MCRSSVVVFYGPCPRQMACLCTTLRSCSCCFLEEFPVRCRPPLSVYHASSWGARVRRAGCQVGREHLSLCAFLGPAGVQAAKLGSEERGVLTPLCAHIPGNSECPALAGRAFGLYGSVVRKCSLHPLGTWIITGGNTLAVVWRCCLPARNLLTRSLVCPDIGAHPAS